MPRLDRDLDEAADQHSLAVRANRAHIDRLLSIHTSKVEEVEQRFNVNVARLVAEFEQESEALAARHRSNVRELTTVIEQVELEERAREQQDITEHQALYELIRNRNIEEDHQVGKNSKFVWKILEFRCARTWRNDSSK